MCPFAVISAGDLLVQCSENLLEDASLELLLHEVTLQRSAWDSLEVSDLFGSVFLERLEVSIETSCSLGDLRHEPLLLLFHGFALGCVECFRVEGCLSSCLCGCGLLHLECTFIV